MIKRILILMMVCVLLLPAQALANDGGPKFDDKEYLTIDFKVESTEVKIGEEFNFTLYLTNNSKYPISMMDITQIFTNTDMREYDDFFEWLSPESIINPGEKMTVEISTHIPKSISWYKSDGKFFCDFDLELMYDACVFDYNEFGELTQEEFNENLGYKEHINKQLKKVPLIITNLNDGNEYLQLSLDSYEKAYYFTDNLNPELSIYNGEYPSLMQSMLHIKNISNHQISALYVLCKSEYYYNNSSIEIASIDSGKTLNEELFSRYFLLPENIPDKLPATYIVNFELENKYYAVQYEELFPTFILNSPEFDIRIIENSSNFDYPNLKYIVTITNKSPYDINSLCVDFDSLYLSNEGKQEIIYLSNENQIRIYTNQYKSFLLGYTINENNYWWNYNVWGEIDQEYYISSMSYNGKDVYEKSSNISFKTPTVSPTYSPIPTSTAKPSQSPTIEITNVKRSSSIPFWVWYVLAIAVVAGVVLTVTLRKKNKEKFE